VLAPRLQVVPLSAASESDMVRQDSAEHHRRSEADTTRKRGLPRHEPVGPMIIGNRWGLSAATVWSTCSRQEKLTREAFAEATRTLSCMFHHDPAGRPGRLERSRLRPSSGNFRQPRR